MFAWSETAPLIRKGETAVEAVQQTSTIRGVAAYCYTEESGAVTLNERYGIHRLPVMTIATRPKKLPTQRKWLPGKLNSALPNPHRIPSW